MLRESSPGQYQTVIVWATDHDNKFYSVKEGLLEGQSGSWDGKQTRTRHLPHSPTPNDCTLSPKQSVYGSPLRDPLDIGYKVWWDSPDGQEGKREWLCDAIKENPPASTTRNREGKIELRWIPGTGPNGQGLLCELDPSRGYMIDRLESTVGENLVQSLIVTKAIQYHDVWLPTKVENRKGGQNTTSVSTIVYGDFHSPVNAGQFTNIFQPGDHVILKRNVTEFIVSPSGELVNSLTDTAVLRLVGKVSAAGFSGLAVIFALIICVKAAKVRSRN